jgi:hypothetical protein
MGLLDALRGKKPKLTVTAEPADAVPGDEVRVRVVVEGEIDDKAQGGRAGLRCVNEYLKREYDRQDEEWDEVWRAVELHADQRDLPLQAGEHELTFTVPEGLPPASAKAVRWEAFAAIERRRGRDATGSTPLAVRLPPPAAADAEPRPVAPDEDGVAFDDLPGAVREGEALYGTLSVTPPDDLRTTGVRVELARVVTYRADGHEIVRRETAAEVEVGGAQELAAGQTQTFPFTLAVPAGLGPTARAPHTVVEWVVKGIVARRLRDDLDLAAPIVVFDGR